jgi:hypothetical protein
MPYLPYAAERADRYRVRVEEYVHYRREGYLKVAQPLPLEDVARLREWADARTCHTPARSSARASISIRPIWCPAHSLRA